MPSDEIPVKSSPSSEPENSITLSLVQKQLQKLNQRQKNIETKEMYSTHEVEAANLVALDDQQEKLGNIEKGMDKISEDMNRVDKLLSALEQNQSSTSGKSCLII